jgi:sporulation protein YlmC with PRC-barrel domain
MFASSQQRRASMRKVVAIATVSSVLGLGLALDGTAQTRPTAPPADQPSSDRTGTSMQRETWKNTQGLRESSTIVGTRVKNAQGKDIGEIEQLMIDPKSGRVTHVVVGVGGFLGIGEKQVIVPWSQLRMSTDGERTDRAVITMDQSVLERAPRYEKRTTSLDRDGSAPSASPRGTVDRPASTTDRPATTTGQPSSSPGTSR